MVYHGKTFTSKVSLRDTCQAISKYAFVASPYPLLISAEIHCGVKQQEILVDIMTGIFGEKLVQAPVENRPKLEKLPSPEDLKFKVLLKVRLHAIPSPQTCIPKKSNMKSLGQKPIRHCEVSGD